MSEDDTGHLEVLKLERERDRVYGKHAGHTRNGDGMHRRILETLIGVAVVTLVAAVWNLRESVAVLQAAQSSFAETTRRDLDRLERRTDTLEGLNLRGGPDASHQ